VSTRTSKRRHDGNGNGEDLSVHEKNMNTLKAQNDMLKAQTDLLRSVDARLGQLVERQDQPGRNIISMRPRSPSTHADGGSWKFVEGSPHARENCQSQVTEKYCFRPSHWEGSFGLLDGGEGMELLGGTCPMMNQTGDPSHFSYRSRGCPIGYIADHYRYMPTWSTDGTEREMLPRLVFDGKPELMHKSGIYSLTIEYTKGNDHDRQDTAIIVGEIEFNSGGFVMAKGADWDRLLNDK
jgi:hypothetical protein